MDHGRADMIKSLGRSLHFTSSREISECRVVNEASHRELALFTWLEMLMQRRQNLYSYLLGRNTHETTAQDYLFYFARLFHCKLESRGL